MDIIDYEEVVSDFNTKLMTQLRSHAAEYEYLEMWVPDQDPVRSILNMAEAAHGYGQDAILVRVAKATLAEANMKDLETEISKIGKISVDSSDATHWLIAVTGL